MKGRVMEIYWVIKTKNNEQEGSYDLESLLEEIESLDAKKVVDIFFDNVWLGLLFANVEMSKENLVKLFSIIKQEKSIIEIWEEGTVGISLVKKGLRKKVLKADFNAVNQFEPFCYDVTRILK